MLTPPLTETRSGSSRASKAPDMSRFPLTRSRTGNPSKLVTFVLTPTSVFPQTIVRAGNDSETIEYKLVRLNMSSPIPTIVLL